MSPSQRAPVALAAVVAMLAATPAQGATAPVSSQLDVAARLLDQPAGRAWALALTVGTTVTTADGSAPPAMSKARLRFPHARVNAGAFPACPPATLQAKGPTACSSASRVGRGTAVVDARPLIPDPIHVDLTMFNGGRAGGAWRLPVLAQAREVGVTLVLDAALRPTTGAYGYRLDLTVPPLHTLDNAPAAALQAFTITVQARRHGVSFVEAPRRCPAGGLAFDGTYTFADGQTAHSGATIPCTLKGVATA